VAERFETDLRAGYLDGASVVLGSPMLDGEVPADVRVRLPLSTVNRHGLVAGATGTGKTKTLQVIAGELSDAGVPVFVADVKGDLSGPAQPIDAADPNVAEPERDPDRGALARVPLLRRPGPAAARPGRPPHDAQGRTWELGAWLAAGAGRSIIHAIRLGEGRRGMNYWHKSRPPEWIWFLVSVLTAAGLQAVGEAASFGVQHAPLPDL
jgi:hypothetical protein